MEHGTLCLTRKINETLVFQYTDENHEPQEITLSISKLIGNQARLMINAPLNMKVMRGELIESAFADES